MGKHLNGGVCPHKDERRADSALKPVEGHRATRPGEAGSVRRAA